MRHKEKQLARALRVALGVGSALSLFGATHTLAQTSPSTTTVERTFVTGSNVRRVDVETPAPVQIITRDEIEKTGLQTVSDIIRLLPADNNGSVSNSFMNGFAPGASGVSLRGLGTTSTLVLLNGRRLAPYGSADDGFRTFVDLNQIPLDAVERIEVLKDGASAIYGSDAIAGVVNVILRQEFQGFTASGSVAGSYKWDAETYRASVAAGFGELVKDKFNVFFSGDFTKQEPLSYRERGEYIGSSDLRFMGLPDLRLGALTSPTALPSGPQGTVRRADPVTGSPSGLTQPLPAGNTCTGDGNTLLATGYCLWEPKNFLNIQPESERYNLFGRGTYQFTPDLQAYAEASLSNSKSTNIFTPLTLRGSWPIAATQSVGSSNNVFLPVGHPDNPFNAENLGARLQYTFFDVGRRDTDIDTDVMRFVAGLKGSHWGWDWDAGAMYVESESDITRKGFVRMSALQQALNGQGGFGYYRIGANAGLNNPGIYNFLAPVGQYTTESSVTLVDAKATRELMQLPGGPLGLAIGGEWRREELTNPGQPGTFEGDVIRTGYAAASGERDVYAFYGELVAPVIKNLELQLALRYDHYDTYGSSTTPKVGFRWTPVQQLLLRGTYSEGFRAPNFFESGNSSSGGFSTFIDPIRCPVTDLAVDCGQSTTLSFATGNPDLQPEESKSYTLGVVWEPVQDLSFGIDYWNIKRTGEITQPDIQLILENPGAFPLAQIVRDDNNLPGIPGSGTVLAVVGPYLNADKVKTDGIDVDIRYRWRTSEWGSFTAGLLYSYIFNYEKTFVSGLTLEYAGTHGPTVISSAAGTPRDKGVASLGWERGPWAATLWVRYVGGMEDKESKESEDCLTGLHTDCHVASFTTVDLTGSYKGFKDWEIFGSIQNLFNRKAPFDAEAGGFTPFYNYTYAQAGALGTYFTVGARYSFK